MYKKGAGARLGTVCPNPVQEDNCHDQYLDNCMSTHRWSRRNSKFAPMGYKALHHCPLSVNRLTDVI